jgi:hypothetical protein
MMIIERKRTSRHELCNQIEIPRKNTCDTWLFYRIQIRIQIKPKFKFKFKLVPNKSQDFEFVASL